MKNFIRLAAAFACTAALAACGEGPSRPAPSASANSPAAPDATSRIHAVTSFAKVDFSEITTTYTPDLTCFTLTHVSMLQSDAASNVTCVDGAPVATPAATAKVVALRDLGKARLYHVQPASRPDVDCYVTQITNDIGTSSAGGLYCRPKR